jgi:hypothetical protein
MNDPAKIALDGPPTITGILHKKTLRAAVVVYARITAQNARRISMGLSRPERKFPNLVPGDYNLSGIFCKGEKGLGLGLGLGEPCDSADAR